MNHSLGWSSEQPTEAQLGEMLDTLREQKKRIENSYAVGSAEKEAKLRAVNALIEKLRMELSSHRNSSIGRMRGKA